ncbi:hypothetical protein BDU57DRAFT_526814 [Ampelomyces quisqualis]|uniref:Uncharacterized protein n=1 Tax=Ampelomyces quisqualis TaxID=50730 RepID=A0A6A5QSF4_AMPQU|nr:hypothetical protein BDU57DRAFT_526814 [Ampelomyces quisqualis]
MADTGTPEEESVEAIYSIITFVLDQVKDDAKLNELDDSHGTPLHVAVELGILDVIELLIARGADTNAKFKDRTPRDYAMDDHRWPLLAAVFVLHDYIKSSSSCAVTRGPSLPVADELAVYSFSCDENHRWNFPAATAHGRGKRYLHVHIFTSTSYYRTRQSGSELPECDVR